jgi:Alcohol dehydrogenase GroES-like domain
VATHAANSPFHGRNFAAYVLHDADYFATDQAIMQQGEDKQPYYRTHWRQGGQGGQIRRGGDYLSSHPPPA